MKQSLFIALSLLLTPHAKAAEVPPPSMVTIPITSDGEINRRDLERVAWVCTAALPGLVGGPSVFEQLASQMEATHLHLNPDETPLFLSYKPGAVGFSGGEAEWVTPAGNSSVNQIVDFDVYTGSNLNKQNARLQFTIFVDITNWAGYWTDPTFEFPIFTYDLPPGSPKLSDLRIQYKVPPGQALHHIPVYDMYTGKITPYAIDGQVYVDCLIRQLKLTAHANE